jgi:hypothetical protein
MSPCSHPKSLPFMARSVTVMRTQTEAIVTGTLQQQIDNSLPMIRTWSWQCSAMRSKPAMRLPHH